MLDDIVNEYNNTAHRTIKMKPIDVMDDSKYKNIFAKGYTPNWSEEVFVVCKIENTVPWTYVVNDLNGEKITGRFYEKERQKTNQKEFRIEKVINYVLNGKVMKIHLIVGLIKKTSYKNE